MTTTSQWLKLLLFVFILSIHLYGKDGIVIVPDNYGDVFTVKIENDEIDRNKIYDHFILINRIGDFVRKYNDCKGNNDTVRVRYSRMYKRIAYININKYGFNSIDFDKNNFLISIEINRKESRRITDQEREWHQINNYKKIPPTYATISQKQAVERATEFIKNVYGDTDANKFDSVRVIQTLREYEVAFRIKMKNDINQFALLQVIINGNTGEFCSFYGSGKIELTDEDYSYVPKISKDEAMQTYFSKAVNEKGIDTALSYIYLSKEKSKTGSFQWVWILT